VEALNKLVAEAEARAQAAEEAREEMKKEMERTAPFEKEVKEKNLLIGKLRHEAIILNDHLAKALKMLKKAKPEDNVDRYVPRFLNPLCMILIVQPNRNQPLPPLPRPRPQRPQKIPNPPNHRRNPLLDRRRARTIRSVAPQWRTLRLLPRNILQLSLQQRTEVKPWRGLSSYAEYAEGFWRSRRLRARRGCRDRRVRRWRGMGRVEDWWEERC
jgi:hypothetical protein